MAIFKWKKKVGDLLAIYTRMDSVLLWLQYYAMRAKFGVSPHNKTKAYANVR